jgi:predicted nucleotidyltransferase
MADQFDRMMEKFMSPISELGPRIKDSIYFLRQDGCFVFSHGYYHPRPGYFLGKIIHYPLATGSENIWGRRYEVMHKAWVNGKHVAVQNDAQIAKHYEIDPSLDPAVPRPLIGSYTLEFRLSDFLGYFDPSRSRRICEKMHPLVKTWVDQTVELMKFPSEKLGVTGSLAYGRIEEEDMDFDVLFVGNLEENDRVLKKIYQLAEEPKRQVFEFGRYWPIRIYYQGFLLCPFFVYQNWDDVPLSEAEVKLVQRNVKGTATVTDDFHNSYLPVVLELGDVEIGGRNYDSLRFISYDGSIRGDYRSGDRIWLKGHLVGIKDRRGEYPAVVVDINRNIKKIARD